MEASRDNDRGAGDSPFETAPSAAAVMPPPEALNHSPYSGTGPFARAMECSLTPV